MQHKNFKIVKRTNATSLLQLLLPLDKCIFWAYTSNNENIAPAPEVRMG